MNDPFESFFDSGILSGHFDMDRELCCAHGHAFWNYPSGMRRIEGHYTRGIRSGCWKESAEDGTVLSIAEFGDGQYTKNAIVPRLSDVNLSPETTILLGEEYGYRSWFWLPDRPLPELLEWWRGIFSVEPWFFSPSPLPGVLIESSEDSDRWETLHNTGLYICGHIHEDDDSELRTPSGELVHHRGRDFSEQSCRG